MHGLASAYIHPRMVRKMLIKRSAPHPRSRNTPRGGKIKAKLRSRMRLFSKRKRRGHERTWSVEAIMSELKEEENSRKSYFANIRSSERHIAVGCAEKELAVFRRLGTGTYVWRSCDVYSHVMYIIYFNNIFLSFRRVQMSAFDIPYAPLSTRDRFREFDLYFPSTAVHRAQSAASTPLICFVHGGAWRS